jgi:MFS family permease
VCQTIVLFAVFAATLGNATVFATLGLFGRGAGLSEFDVGTILALSALLFSLTSSYWGRLSDRFGRAPIMVAGLVATAVSLFLFATLYAVDWSYAFLSLLLARAIYGLFAGAIQPAAMAWMAGTTRSEQRAAGVARIGAAVGIASIAGPAFTASTVSLGLYAPVAAGGAVVALAAVATLAGLREERRRPAPPSAVAPAAEGLGSCLAVAFAMVVGFGALQPTTAFFVQDRFRLDIADAVREASVASACFAAASFVVQAFIVRRLAANPRTLLVLGLALCLLGVRSSLLARTATWLAAAFLVLGGGYGLAQSGLSASVSLLGGEHRQGQMAGRLQAVMSTAWIAGALGGSALYPLSIAAPLYVAAGAMVLALSLSYAGVPSDTAQMRR